MKPGNKVIRPAIIAFAIGLALFAAMLMPGESRADQVPYSDFIAAVQRGEVRSVRIQQQVIEGQRQDFRPISTYAPEGADMIPVLREHGVEIVAVPPSNNRFGAIIGGLLPILLLLAIFFFIARRMRSGGAGGGAGGLMSVGKSKAKLLTEAHGRVTFDDVAGIDEAKEDLMEIVEFLRDPQKFQRLGGRIPRGVLLVGPPGTGKTLTARAVAGEANVPFFTISGSDFVEMFVGVGASRVRDMFEQAKKNSPCIIFIDEIDAVGRHRGAGMGGGNDEREQTLNQLLVEMDGFEANEGVIIIAATNRPDVLDAALLRPGRFDRQIVVSNPDVLGREKILRVHMRKVPLAPDVDVKVIARGTPGFSGADLMNLVNEAALLAARRSKRIVTMAEFEDAKDKVLMGAERRTLVMTDDEKRLTAYHEAGHTIVALRVAAADPLHKVTIIPRGRSLGVMMQLPERDQISMSLIQMTSKLAILMGGRIAEEMTFGKEKVTSGAQMDIDMATRLAKAMVTRWGFSDLLGTVSYGQDDGYMGMPRQQSISEDTAQAIDAEIRRFVEAGLQEARQILTDNKHELEIVAQGLLEYETLSGDEVKNLLAGVQPVRDVAQTPGPARGSIVPSAGKNRPRDEPDPGMEPQPQA